MTFPEKKEISAIIKQLKIDILKGFEIVIFYPNFGSDKIDLQDKATEIKRHLEGQGLQSDKIRTKSFTKEWITKIGGLSNNQIRYERGVEDEAAKIVKEILDNSNIKPKFRLQTIRGRSENYLSIFLKDLN